MPPHKMPDDDNALLNRWREGDKASGDMLFRRHFRAVRRFFRNKINEDDVDDLIQRTFMGCVEGKDRFRGDASFRTYLFATARKQLYQFLRTRGRMMRKVDADLGVTSVAALGMTPSSVAAARQEHDILLRAFQRVPVEQQTILELSYWEDLSGPEIAAIFDISPVTARTRLFRARAALQEVIVGLTQPGVPFDVDAAAATLPKR